MIDAHSIDWARAVVDDDAVDGVMPPPDGPPDDTLEDATLFIELTDECSDEG